MNTVVKNYVAQSTITDSPTRDIMDILNHRCLENKVRSNTVVKI